MKYTKKEAELEILDEHLLKGFYTNDRVELGNPPFILNDKKLTIKKDKKVEEKKNRLQESIR